MRQAYLVGGVRTPIGKFGGSLAKVRCDDMAAGVIKTLLSRHEHLDPAAVDDVILGNANQAGEDNRNLARMALLLAGLPIEVPGETVNRLCASGLSAVVSAGRAIACDDADVIIAGGAEHMTRAPYVVSKSASPFGRDAVMYDTSIGWRFPNPQMEASYGIDPMGVTAENVADLFNISRGDQDKFALNSQLKAAKSRSAGRFEREIDPVRVPRRKAEDLIFDQDEFIRPESTMAGLERLRPAFREGGTVTAGNASGINDGACALLVVSESALETFQLKPKARIVASGVVGVAPRIMGMGPVEASRKALRTAGLELKDMDVIELNEAFAAQSLACLRELGLDDEDARVNPNGGAIALGHPLGMTGARLALTAMHELEICQGRYALVTMCVGVGQGMAAILERVD